MEMGPKSRDLRESGETEQSGFNSRRLHCPKTQRKHPHRKGLCLPKG